jgi:hypothetical protein
MGTLDSAWTSDQCPACGFELQFRLSDARFESEVRCTACYATVKLTDDIVTVEQGSRRVTRAMNRLEEAVVRLDGLTIEIEI